MPERKLLLLSVGLIFGGLFSACTLFSSLTTKKAAPDELFLVGKMKDDGKTWVRGFMDKTGKIVVGPWETFEWNGKKYGSDSYKPLSFEVMPFVEGMAGICFYDEAKSSFDANGKCGFIDKTGKIVVEPKYKQIGYFSEGLAAVSEEADKSTGKFGYIDQTGNMVIEPKFISKGAFSDGLAPVAERTGKNPNETFIVKYGYIDKTGKYVIEKKYEFLSGFGDGHAIVKNETGQKVIIDKTGKEIKPVQTESAGNTDYYYQNSIKSRFYEGYAVENYSAMPAFNESLTMTYDRGKTIPIGFTNTKGELEIRLDPQTVGEIRPFAEGFAPIGWRVKEEEKLTQIFGAEAVQGVFDWTYIDRKGNAKVPLENTFQDARPFAEGMAAVKPRPNEKGNWGFINAEFKLVIPACFEKVSDFRGGLASVLIYNYPKEIKGCEAYDFGSNYDERNAYIDKAGKIIKPQW
jgi:hypothetical protein